MSTLEITAARGRDRREGPRKTQCPPHMSVRGRGPARWRPGSHGSDRMCVCVWVQIRASACKCIHASVCVCVCVSMYLVPCVAQLSRCCHQGIWHIYWGYVHIEHMEDKSHTQLEEKYKLIPIWAKKLFCRPRIRGFFIRHHQHIQIYMFDCIPSRPQPSAYAFVCVCLRCSEPFSRGVT